MSARLKPHQVRGRQLEEVREKDPDGRIASHHRTVDTLGKMLRAGDDRPGDARCRRGLSGDVHRRQPRPAPGATDFPGAGTGREPELNERQLHANRRVHNAMEALGGIPGPAG